MFQLRLVKPNEHCTSTTTTATYKAANICLGALTAIAENMSETRCTHRHTLILIRRYVRTFSLLILLISIHALVALASRLVTHSTFGYFAVTFRLSHACLLLAIGEKRTTLIQLTIDFPSCSFIFGLFSITCLR